MASKDDRVSKFVSYTLLTSHDDRASKLVGYTVVTPVVTDRVSKFVSYVLLSPNTDDVSKFVGYGVLSSRDDAVSKFVGYAVLTPGAANEADVSKFVGYAVLHTNDVSDNVSKFVAYAVLFRESVVRLPLIVAEPVTDGQPAVRFPLAVAEPVTGGNPSVKLPLILADPVTGGNPRVRCPVITIEVIYGLREPVVTATAVFPTMRGLSWSVHKKPQFNTKVADHVSGHEVRAAFYQYPLWEFNLTFEYLPNRDGAKDLEELMGFFLQRQGQYDAFLFHDANDYRAVAQPVGIGDGGTVRWQVARTLGGFTEVIGQFDLEEAFGFTTADVTPAADTIDVPEHGLATGYGPVQLTGATLPAGLALATNYWIIAAGANAVKLALSPALAAAGTAVNITGTGSGGPFVASNSVAIYDNGTEVDPDDYTITAPNIVEFDVAPVDTHVITWSGRYFFVCRFIDDIQDYENFMYNLWTLQECNIKSVLTVE